jgi:hypothetical protein
VYTEASPETGINEGDGLHAHGEDWDGLSGDVVDDGAELIGLYQW